MTLPRGSRPALAIDIPFRVIVKLLATALLVLTLIWLVPLITLVLFSILLAVTLHPARAWLSRHLPLWAATTVISLGLILLVGLLVGGLVPLVIGQLSGVAERWGSIRADILAAFPHDRFFAPLLGKILNDPGSIIGGKLPDRLVSFGSVAIGGLTGLVLVLTLAVYFLVEGKQTIQWLLAFFRPEFRFKVYQTLGEMSEVVSAYVAGQFITSVLVALYSGVLLAVLGVPGALLLAVLAGVLDVLPVVGFILSIVPATLLGMTVSGQAALIVAIAYILYHAVENYFIVPVVYGNKLRLSTLVVLLALLVGGTIGGIPGAILALPIAASYPIIERIWLKRYVGQDVVEKHAA